MKMLYFAWFRQRIGQGEEDIDLPADVSTVGELITWLQGRGPGYAAALDDLSVVRVAVNQEFSSLSDPVANSDEVALFPPVTGGTEPGTGR
ncbi:MAG: molybdopterin converting factor subunit 1 [Alphaproteobacteria bacterium]|jgi:molybdopterin synthase sulfur carrier subunit|nr:molybdopterin converting factor subunit 1 [Alphaproteobacteria bacterium]